MNKTFLVIVILCALIACLAASVVAQVLPPDPMPRVNGDCVWVNGKVFWGLGATPNQRVAGQTPIDAAGKVYTSNSGWCEAAGISIYDPATNTWRSSKWNDPTSPIGFDYDGDGVCDRAQGLTGQIGVWSQANNAVAYNGKVYHVFGYVSDDIYEYDPAANGGRGAWTKICTRPDWNGCRRGVVAIYGSKIYLASCGGVPLGGGRLASYDIATGVWKDYGAGTSPASERGAGAVCDQYLVYAGGGANGGTNIYVADLSVAEQTPPQVPTFTTYTGALTAGVRSCQAVAYNHKVYILGGKKYSGSQDSTDIITEINPATGAATVLTAVLPFARHAFGAAVDPATGTIYVGGGGTGDEAIPTVPAQPEGTKWWKANLNNLAAGWTPIASDPASFPYTDWVTGEAMASSVTITVKAYGEPVAGALVGVSTLPNAKSVFANAPNYYKTNASGQVKIYAPESTTVTAGAYATGFNPSKDYSLVTTAGNNTLDVEVEVAGVAKEVGATISANYSLTNAAPLNVVIDGLLRANNDLRWNPASDWTRVDPLKFPAAYIDSTLVGQNQTPPLDVTVDLGADTGIVGAHLEMGLEPLTNYQILALPAAYDPSVPANWNNATVAFSVTGSNGGCPSLNPGQPGTAFQPAMRFVNAGGDPITVTGRYWRLHVTKAPLIGINLYEWQLFGTEPSIALLPTNNRIATAKGLNDGDAICIINKVVTGSGNNVPGGCFYIEDSNRAAGIRVIAAEGMSIPATGSVVTAVGTLTTTPDGEKAIQATDVKATATGGILQPLGINNKALAAELTAGLLVKIWGTASSPDAAAGTFMLNDGSDTTGTGTKVIAGASAIPSDGSFNAFEGIVGKEAGVPVIYLTNISLLTGDVLGDGWLKSWLINGPYQVANPGGSNPAWQQANLANDFLTTDGGETAINPLPGMLSNGKKWAATTQVGGSRFGLENVWAGQNTSQMSTYAFVYLYSPETYDGWPKSAQLRLGSDDGIRAWVNGAMVHANDTAGRGVTPDQDQVLTTLHQGWNTLLLKINNIDGSYGFCARMMADDGTGTYVPLPGLKFSLYPQE